MSEQTTLIDAARAWADGDPDPETRGELLALIGARDVTALEARMQPLTFGTAGLRGAVGAGSGRMNLAVVLRAAHGIARYLAETETPARIVIGFDARPTSRGFAEASAGVLLAAGFKVTAFSAPVATPLCAFLGRELGAACTIVVTASHNPRGDNGYKVYGADAVQIVSPVDRLIAQHIAQAPPARSVPRQDVSLDVARAGLNLLAPDALHAYFQALSRAIPAGSAARDLGIVHTALHGVGRAPMRRALGEAGFSQVSDVASQADPDGSFPTTAFPNPEEPGTLDLALAETERVGGALLLASDPDADRLAVAARLDGVLTVLDGNQLGTLLADDALSRAAAGAAPLVLSSIVSSPIIELMARARGARSERTHTGFKWLWSAALQLEREGAGKFCFACEEALGYSVFPEVRDKDGIAAGRAVAELAAELAARGLGLFDRLFELYSEHGFWTSGALNVALSGTDAMARVARSLDAAATGNVVQVGSERVVRVVDYRAASQRPAWLGPAPLVELELERGSRLFVRPSGTEPKLKLYAHLRSEITPRVEFARALADRRASAVALLAALERSLRLRGS